MATKKWILHMDADERFHPQDMLDLYKLTERDQEAWTFHVFNYLKQRFDGSKGSYASSEACRLFKRCDEFYYTGIIHETIDDSKRRVASKRSLKISRVKKFPLHHYGYLRKDRTVRKKVDYYEELNNKQLELTEGKDARPYFNLALHYLNDDKQKQALEMFQKALQINPNFYLAQSQMAALNMKSARTFLLQALQRMPMEHPFRKQAEGIVQWIEQNDFGCAKVV